VVRTQEVGDKTGLSVEDMMMTAGMSWTDNTDLIVISADGMKQYQLNSSNLMEFHLINENGIVNLYHNQSLVLNDVLRIQKP
jgi:hypothetical protein